MTPAEGAFFLGVPNLIMVRYDNRPEPPFDRYAQAFRPLRRFVWSIVGAGGATEEADIEAVRTLAEKYPNMSGIMMDDFFRDDPDQPGVYTPDALRSIRSRIHRAGRPLDLWVVLYQHQLHLPIQRHLELCEVVTFWTWRAEGLRDLEAQFGRFETLTPENRRMLGCYMWDYGNRRPMPVDLMEHQCRLGLEWLRQGRIEGMIFLASCICDLELEAVEWTREWIRAVGDEAR